MFNFFQIIPTLLIAMTNNSPKYTLHLYDHCPFCVRAELILGLFEIPYDRVVYNYGEGASSDKLGYNEDGGPVALTGKKMLPVLCGPDVPSPIRFDGKGKMKGLPESLDIIAFLVKKHGLTLPCETSPDKLVQWKKRFVQYKSKLTRPRLINIKVKDWEDKRDIDYAKNKYQKGGFDYEEALEQTDELMKEMNDILIQLDNLIEGEESIRPWGIGMDDIKLLPDMKSLSAVKGIVWPKKSTPLD